MKQIIDLDEVVEIAQKRSRINDIDILDAVFVRNGVVIDVDTKTREDFKFTGLCTIEFVLSDFGNIL